MVEGYVPREHYMTRIRQARGPALIKVLTGIRRCGKSTLMSAYIDELKASGVPDDRIFAVNLDDEGTGIENFHDLIHAVDAKVDDVKGAFIFLDEVQNVQWWERAVATFHVRGADIYITGSNSDMLSSDISTKLSGRCLEIKIQPPVFSEYVLFRDPSDMQALFKDYMRYGGFPIASFSRDSMPTHTVDILDGIYNTVFSKDVIGRYEIRNAQLIFHLCEYLMKNIGDRTSVRGAANYMISKGLKVQPATIDQYLGFLEEARLFSKAKRLDAKAKEYLRTTDKFYISDLGIRHARIPFDLDDLDGLLENAVYNELTYRYRDVAVCAVGRHEVDFIADPMGSPSYYQVTLSILDPQVREREIRALKELDDNYPKTVITYDSYPVSDIDGIRVVNVIDWMLESRCGGSNDGHAADRGLMVTTPPQSSRV